ncbi:hypothetical protein [Maritalea sp.]|uniref:hypothetical protein n=1 Tax=Maritalea sp. TaxID=2003361 RepID=UPI003EF47240
MQNLDHLKELANFEPKSELASKDESVRKSALLRIAKNVAERSQGKTVAEMLNSVMALSSRTRRVLQDRTHIELDVFNANGSRAVLIEFGDQNKN